jgi:hypothetical protein
MSYMSLETNLLLRCKKINNLRLLSQWRAILGKNFRSLESLDVCATSQLDTMTLRPAPSDTVTIRTMSCCSLATQLQLYD